MVSVGGNGVQVAVGKGFLWGRRVLGEGGGGRVESGEWWLACLLCFFLLSIAQTRRILG